MRHRERRRRKRRGQQRAEGVVEAGDGIGRQARRDARTRADPSTPSVVRVPNLDVEREGLEVVALAAALVSFVLGLAGNGLSRRMEARADAFALELTKDPKAFVELEQRLAVTNVSEPDPPEVLHALFGTHPTTVERIGFGVEYKREHEPGRNGR